MFPNRTASMKHSIRSQRPGQNWISSCTPSLTRTRKSSRADTLIPSRENFLNTLDISCYSFTAVAQRAARSMNEGGSLLTLTYDGSQRVMPNYNIMGIAKAALEAKRSIPRSRPPAVRVFASTRSLPGRCERWRAPQLAARGSFLNGKVKTPPFGVTYRWKISEVRAFISYPTCRVP